MVFRKAMYKNMIGGVVEKTAESEEERHDLLKDGWHDSEEYARLFKAEVEEEVVAVPVIKKTRKPRTKKAK